MFKSIMLAAVYGTLVNGGFVKAPFSAKVDGYNRPVESLTEAQANALGYKLLVNERPVCASNEYAVAVGYVLDPQGSRIRRLYRIETITPSPRKFSKLKIYGAIAQLGAWEKVETWLKAKTINGINGWMAFQLAQEISEDHPMFAPLAAEAKALLGLTDAQFEALLNQCILED